SMNCQKNDVPIFRFYGWSPFCVSIGYHQKDELVDFARLVEDGYDFVQRPTGGRAILHAEELTYSVIVPRELIHHRLLYRFIHNLFSDALQSLGYQVELKDDNDKLGGLTHSVNDFPCFTKSAQTEVQYKDKKLIGSAQKIYQGSILQHGSLLIGKKHETLTDYLKVDKNVKKSLKNEINEKTICLKEIIKDPISPEKIIESIINQLELAGNISLYSKRINELEMNSLNKFIKK
ncbi:unnamed protein product, partial [marine sediment metagenome]